MRPAADRAGREPELLHERRLPRPDRAPPHPSASRAAADIEAVGPVSIERLSEAGLLERRSDFYALGRDDLLRFDGIEEVSADR